MRKTLMVLSGLALMAGSPALAENWTLDGDASKVAFGSIKNNTAGEIHHFTSMSGSVDDSGKVSVEIDLASLETWIEIRNERMQSMVFDGGPKAMLTAQVDAEALGKLGPGDTTTVDVKGTLTLNGKDIPVETGLFIARLSDSKMMATTDEMIMLSTADVGIDEGITKLQEVAELSGITRVSPVTMRLVFNAGGEAKTAAAAPAAAATPPAEEAPAATDVAALPGDPAKGARVFRKCQACHVVGDTKNKVGPHLNEVIGRKIASVEGFKYSKAFMEQDLVWTPENLTEYLANPRKFIKGTKMAFAGLRKAEDIENVLAYLQSESK